VNYGRGDKKIGEGIDLKNEFVPVTSYEYSKGH
jgi:hypothetical protein